MNNKLLAFDIGEKLGNEGVNFRDNYSDISSLVSSFLQNAFTVSTIILLFLLVFGGITFIAGAGSGDEKKTSQAKSALTSALIGFAVVFSAYFIVQIIQVITGVQILDNTGL
jgi:Zn-dependent protease with chaperone function